MSHDVPCMCTRVDRQQDSKCSPLLNTTMGLIQNRPHTVLSHAVSDSCMRNEIFFSDPNSINQNLHLIFVVEAYQSLHRSTLMRGIWVVPNQILVLFASNSDGEIPVSVSLRHVLHHAGSWHLRGFSLVWTSSLQRTLLYTTPFPDACRRQVIRLFKTCLIE